MDFVNTVKNKIVHHSYNIDILLTIIYTLDNKGIYNIVRHKLVLVPVAQVARAVRCISPRGVLSP